MFVAFLFIPVVAGNVFMEESIPNIPEITERQSTWTQDYTIFDPCNTNKPGNRNVSCSQLKRQGHNDNKEYKIYILGKPIKVTCDMKSKDGGGWTVIQRQSKDEKNESFFDRKFEEYESGFGTAGGSFWIGLENLRALTSFPNNQQALKIEMKRSNGQWSTTVVYYHKFQVGSKDQQYKLTIEEYDYKKAGTVYNAMSNQNGTGFTVKLNGKPKSKEPSCFKETLTGGWWFKVNECNYANLNGRKIGIVLDSKPRGITWIETGKTDSYYYTFEKVEMKIRDADFGFCTGKKKS
uniref:Putative ficolin/ixoderin n=1 Tax=Ixodes ricinus TaxID=34613 RepID=A0A6B0V9E7_IXORI